MHAIMNCTSEIASNCESHHRRQSWGLGCRDPTDFEQGVAERFVEGRGRIVKHNYNYILSCTLQEVCSKVVTFQAK